MTEYPKPAAGSQPDYAAPAYKSTTLRAPSKPLIQLPHSLSELTGPVYGHNPIGPTDNDLTLHFPSAPQGERIIVLHRLSPTDLAACLEKFAGCDLPNLWKPKVDAFYHVDSFPMLGTGKLDLRGVKELAVKLAV